MYTGLALGLLKTNAVVPSMGIPQDERHCKRA